MCEAAAAATGQCSPRGFGDGLRMPGARARSVFDRASVHSAHRTTNKGYVTVNQGKDAMACIHAPNGAGICWPGGKTGYNEVRSESTQVDHLSRSSRILTCLVCLSVRAACHVSVMPGRQHITRKAQVTPGGSRDHGDASKLPGVARRVLAKLCDNLHQNVHTATSVGPFRPRRPSSPCTEHNKNVPLTKRIPQRAPPTFLQHHLPPASRKHRRPNCCQHQQKSATCPRSVRVPWWNRRGHQRRSERPLLRLRLSRSLS